MCLCVWYLTSGVKTRYQEGSLYGEELANELGVQRYQSLVVLKSNSGVWRAHGFSLMVSEVSSVVTASYGTITEFILLILSCMDQLNSSLPKGQYMWGNKKSLSETRVVKAWEDRYCSDGQGNSRVCRCVTADEEPHKIFLDQLQWRHIKLWSRYMHVKEAARVMWRERQNDDDLGESYIDVHVKSSSL